MKSYHGSFNGSFQSFKWLKILDAHFPTMVAIDSYQSSCLILLA